MGPAQHTLATLATLIAWAGVQNTAAVPGGMMGMGGVVAMRRNADLHSDYAFAVDTGRGPGHPDISDYGEYGAAVDYGDYDGDYGGDYGGHTGVTVEREAAAHHGDFVHYDDIGSNYDYGFTYDVGAFDYY